MSGDVLILGGAVVVTLITHLLETRRLERELEEIKRRLTLLEAVRSPGRRC